MSDQCIGLVEPCARLCGPPVIWSTGTKVAYMIFSSFAVSLMVYSATALAPGTSGGYASDLMTLFGSVAGGYGFGRVQELRGSSAVACAICATGAATFVLYANFVALRELQGSSIVAGVVGIGPYLLIVERGGQVLSLYKRWVTFAIMFSIILVGVFAGAILQMLLNIRSPLHTQRSCWFGSFLFAVSFVVDRWFSDLLPQPVLGQLTSAGSLNTRIYEAAHGSYFGATEKEGAESVAT